MASADLHAAGVREPVFKFRTAYDLALTGHAGMLTMPRMQTHARTSFAALLAVNLIAIGIAGCAGPLEQSSHDALRQSLLDSYRTSWGDKAELPTVKLERQPSDVDQRLSQDELDALDNSSGPESYQSEKLELGSNLTGKKQADATELTLTRAVELAVEHNLPIRIARLTPAIAREQLTQARSIFDTTFFADLEYANLDTPRPPGVVTGFAGDQQTNQIELSTGIRKSFSTGTAIEASTSATHINQKPTAFAVNDYNEADISLSVTQPLLQGFGQQVNRATIVLNENNEKRQTAALRTTLLQLVTDVETAYWQLSLARHRVLVQTRLLNRTIEDRDRLEGRADFDVSPVRITEANSFVELRRAEVIRARQDVRVLSDRLKQLINSPELPVTGEMLIVPTDKPIEEPVTFNLLDAVLTALRQRPEMQAALLDIDDAAVRQQVADNAKLPQLDLGATLGINGLDTNSTIEAYEEITEGNYIDYLLSLSFEQPIGNREARALSQQRRLEQQSAVLAYKNRAQETVIEVKNALRQVITTYELILANRAARRAAADSLRAIEEQERAGVALTPEFLLDLKLSTQQRLADAQTQEYQSLVTYNTAITELYRVMGTLLERNQIDVQPLPAN